MPPVAPTTCTPSQIQNNWHVWHCTDAKQAVRVASMGLALFHVHCFVHNTLHIARRTLTSTSSPLPSAANALKPVPKSRGEAATFCKVCTYCICSSFVSFLRWDRHWYTVFQPVLEEHTDVARSVELKERAPHKPLRVTFKSHVFSLNSELIS